MAPGGMPLLPDTASEIIQQIQYLRQRVHEAGEDYEKMKQEQESFAIQYHECAKLNGEWPGSGSGTLLKAIHINCGYYGLLVGTNGTMPRQEESDSYKHAYAEHC